ncbi:hypothetical protein ACLOJK_035843 [Asimina triloba]
MAKALHTRPAAHSSNSIHPRTISNPLAAAAAAPEESQPRVMAGLLRQSLPFISFHCSSPFSRARPRTKIHFQTHRLPFKPTQARRLLLLSCFSSSASSPQSQPLASLNSDSPIKKPPAPPEFQIFNTMTRQKEVFRPIVPGKVGMYVCGVTAYDLSHIGHARVYVTFDVLCRFCFLSLYLSVAGRC